MSRHVAFVLAGLGAGGAERVIAALSDALVRAGWQVSVISFDAPGDLVYHSFAPEVQLVRLNIPLGGRHFAVLQAASRIVALRKTIRSLRPEIMVSFLTKINVISILSCLGLGVPVIVSERNNPRRQRANILWRVLLSQLYPRAGAIVMQTERSKSCLPSAQRKRALVIPNPVMLPATQPVPSDQRRITAVGRLEAQKGFDLLIDAFAPIARQHDGWQLLIWGEGPERGQLTCQIQALGLSGCVHLPGHSATAGGWIDPGGIFILSSRYEGLPNALGEAMAAGMAVIAFDCEFGPRELIQSGVDGVLVPAEDVASLTTKIVELMRDSRARHRLASRATTAMRGFGVQQICAKWVDLLDSFAPDL